MKKTPAHIIQQIAALREQGMTPPRIAKALGLSAPTVRTILESDLDLIPELKRTLESVQVPRELKDLPLGGYIEYSKEELLRCIGMAKMLNDAMFKNFQRRWVVKVNKKENKVIIQRVG